MALFVLLLEDIHFLSLSFPFLAMSNFFMQDFACLLHDESAQLFSFLFLFPGYFCSVVYTVSIVFGGCK